MSEILRLNSVHYTLRRATGRRTFLSVLIALLPATMVSCRRRGRRVIGVVPKGTNSMFWRSVQAGVLAAGRDLDVEIRWNGPTKETDFSRQIQIVESMINGRVDGIVLSPTERMALAGVVERAADLGIPVTILDSKVATERYVSFVATDNHAAGLSGARRVSELLGGVGRVAVIRDVPGASSIGERERAFESALREDYAGLEIVAEQYAMADRARALAVAETMLTAHPELDGFFCSGEETTLGAARALRARGLAGKVKLVGFDASPGLQQGLRDGVIDALLIQDTFRIGYLGVETVVQKLNGETPQRSIQFPARIITATDLDDPTVRKLVDGNVQ